jgi:hypothetical protein
MSTTVQEEILVADQADCAGWLRDVVTAVAVADPSANVVGAAFYSHFFGGRFGPTQIVPEIEVAVAAEEEITTIETILVSLEPPYRWRVRTRRDAESALIAGRGRASLVDGHVAFSFGHPDAAAHLAEGLLAPADDASPERARAEAMTLLAQYPGLRADFLAYRGKDLAQTFEEIDALVKEQESGGRRTTMSFAPAELPWVAAIRRWHETVEPSIEAVPLPARAPLPEGDPWTADDDSFREWLLDQTSTADPRTPRDEDLHRLFEVQRGDQKPTHLGWETYQHAIMAMLTLDTHGFDVADRRALRVAVLMHDIGKVHNVWTPGAHALIGAKVWQRYRPAWITDEEADVVTFLIRTHDMLGLMDRGIWHDEYRGAMSPADIRDELARLDRPFDEALRLMSAMYVADIASVAALRWLLSLTPLLEGVARAGAEG